MTFTQINSKVVQAEISGQNTVISRREAMLGYSGTVAFRPLGATQGGAGGIMGMAAGESVRMMAGEGDGKVLYGYRGLYVTIINLNGETLTVEADRLLAHSANLQTAVKMIGQGGLRAAVGGMATGQGLFTTNISGHGTVAVLSHGGTIALPVNGETVGVDPQAYVGHTGNLNVDLKAKVGWRDAVGRGSGEAFQLAVAGTGTVYVQASEKKF